MPQTLASIIAFIETVHPYDTLPKNELARVAGSFVRSLKSKGETVYDAGSAIDGLFIVERGQIQVTEVNGDVISLLGPRNSFGERGLMRGGVAVTTATASEDSQLLRLPAAEFHRLVAAIPSFERFFTRGRGAALRGQDFTTRKVEEMMARRPVVIAPDATVTDAARAMRDNRVSSLGIVEGTQFLGIVTTRDMTNKVLADSLSPSTPVRAVMTPNPLTLTPSSLGSDVLHLMLERSIGHLPVVEGQTLVGMVTQTDLTRFHAVGSAQLVRDATRAETVADLAAVTAHIPRLLLNLVGSHTPHEIVTRLITDIADTVTRRLIAMAEDTLGPAPVPWLWLACGSQGRQEQTGVSDQDNCLMIDDTATEADMAYFAAFAKIVSDGLDACGYVYCPGEMMATTPRWCQPMRVWREYFRSWIATPDPMAQMLASVMFDLRPIAGETRLFSNLQEETLSMAARNTIFVAHLVSNSLKHTPPLGLLRGFATIRSGEHKDTLDMKHNGVVPITDLARVYALLGKIEPVNTRARLEAAEAAVIISPSGARDLIDAYDLIAETRLENQARQVRTGEKPSNFLAPADLSDFERSHLRDAFVVVRTMQSALGQSRGARG